MKVLKSKNKLPLIYIRKDQLKSLISIPKIFHLGYKNISNTQLQLAIVFQWIHIRH